MDQFVPKFNSPTPCIPVIKFHLNPLCDLEEQKRVAEETQNSSYDLVWKANSVREVHYKLNLLLFVEQSVKSKL
jgi:menaquinone-dependent protoporphyrinogen IX oxidase